MFGEARRYASKILNLLNVLGHFSSGRQYGRWPVYTRNISVLSTEGTEHTRNTFVAVRNRYGNGFGLQAMTVCSLSSGRTHTVWIPIEYHTHHLWCESLRLYTALPRCNTAFKANKYHIYNDHITIIFRMVNRPGTSKTCRNLEALWK